MGNICSIPLCDTGVSCTLCGCEVDPDHVATQRRWAAMLAEHWKEYVPGGGADLDFLSVVKCGPSEFEDPVYFFVFSVGDTAGFIEAVNMSCA